MKEKWKDMSNEELCLEYQQTNNNDLFEYFMNRNMGLIYLQLRIALRRTLGDEDSVIQFGRIAMWKAMQNFDIEKNVKFSTYFYYWVLSQLRDLKYETADIPLPKHVWNNERKFREERPELFMGKSSLSDIVGEIEDLTLEDKIASDENIEQQMLDKALHDELVAYARRLPARTCLCILDYFGLIDGIPKTLQILGDKYGVTRERIRQVIAQGLKKIKIWYKKDHKE